MSQKSYELQAEARDRVGKGSARALRRSGRIPAVIYGDNKPPLSISLPYKEVHLKLNAGGFMTTLATIDVNGEKIQVLPRDFQLDPVRDFTMHVDFLRVGKGSVVTVNIPVHFAHEEASPGIKRGGVLNIVRHEVEVSAPATAIPEYITVDLTGLDIGDSVHISAITLPEGVKPTITDRDFTVATVAAPASLRSEDEEAADEGADEEAETEAAEEEAEGDTEE
ncbi:MAG: 50S ribosomal protein L25/general stress protein Ctc [Rhizobiaceae bacterium]|nr:50S ribosomal protein L25/general stress protein Ctc [Rhizobiaceae bacterium]MCC0043251.1 50S ribosomal protein L25/general stress protein Ctc [Brucellaceae bacterium]